MAQFRILLLAAILMFSGVVVDAYGPGDNGYVGLRDDYYETSCKDVETVIKKAVQAELAKNLKHAAGVLRMHFHDCFVEVSLRLCLRSHVYPVHELFGRSRFQLLQFDTIHEAYSCMSPVVCDHQNLHLSMNVKVVEVTMHAANGMHVFAGLRCFCTSRRA